MLEEKEFEELKRIPFISSAENKVGKFYDVLVLWYSIKMWTFGKQ